LSNDIRGFLVHVLKRKYIVLNDALCYSAEKIIVCHELGHARLHANSGYYLHPDSTYYIPCRREQEANEYAIHLLSYSTDIDSEIVSRIIAEKQPNPHEVHMILGKLITI
jgi:Zn-dependent peptidase ImmA (M78 family)